MTSKAELVRMRRRLAAEDPDGAVARRLATDPTYGQVRSGLDWPPIIERAAEIVDGYSIMITLRQLFYRLVSEQAIPNTDSAYKQLSSLTADRRRRGTFPALHEDARKIRVPTTWTSPADALESLIASYREDRTDGQAATVMLGVEKNALGGLLESWFGGLGIPVVPLGGYGSQTIEQKVRDYAAEYARPARLIYAGDFDAAGMDIGRCFIEKTADVWSETTRIALSPDQISAMGLPLLEGKSKDSKAPAFIAAFPAIHDAAGYGPGVPVQVELDAVEPLTLRDMYQRAIDLDWDADAYADALAREAASLDQLRGLLVEL